jgi:hypothetical protein
MGSPAQTRYHVFKEQKCRYTIMPCGASASAQGMYMKRIDSRTVLLGGTLYGMWPVPVAHCMAIVHGVGALQYHVFPYRWTPHLYVIRSAVTLKKARVSDPQ